MKYTGPERRIGYRRESDRDVCAYHDICKQSNRDNFKNQKEFNEKMEQHLDQKLPTWVFKLFLSTAIPVLIGLMAWLAIQAIETNKVIVRLDTNQIRLMRTFDVPAKTE